MRCDGHNRCNDAKNGHMVALFYESFFRYKVLRHLEKPVEAPGDFKFIFKYYMKLKIWYVTHLIKRLPRVWLHLFKIDV